MIHVDLFSGIGGFALAADTVWGGASMQHIFCDNDPFCRAVLKKHWPESEIYDDIRTIITDADIHRRHGWAQVDPTDPGQQTFSKLARGDIARVGLLTGGFPCQPFSQAGARGGSGDERYLWPEMFAVIRLAKPAWVIAENVSGLLTWDEGVVFEQVCSDLESAGYEVQPIIIPAAGVGAPHRRDRIWFIAHAVGNEHRGRRGPAGKSDGVPEVDRAQHIQPRQSGGAGKDVADTNGDGLQKPRAEQQTDGRGSSNQTAADSGDTRPQRPRQRSAKGHGGQSDRDRSEKGHDWSQDWAEIAAELCSVDDGLPAELGGLKLSKAAHRTRQIKAYGNAIVPQVAMEIMRGMAL